MEKERKKKKIEEREYFDDDTLTEFVVNEGIEEIGKGAFSDCSNLETISFSRGIRKIGDFAFFSCEKIEEIILKEGLEEIGGGAFDSCSRLKHVVLVKGIRKIGERAFEDTALTHFEMNEGLEEVGFGIFVGCKELKTVSFLIHKIKYFHAYALVGDIKWDDYRSDWIPSGPPLSLQTLILRRPVSSPVTIPFPKVTDEDRGQLVRFVEEQQEKYTRLELKIVNTYFFTCFVLKCARTGLYNAYGALVLARIFRFVFRGPSLPFPIRGISEWRKSIRT